MKWAFYSIVVAFLVGNTGCADQKRLEQGKSAAGQQMLTELIVEQNKLLEQQKATEQKIAELKIAEQKLAEQQRVTAAQQRATEQKLADLRLAEQKLPEQQRLVEQKPVSPPPVLRNPAEHERVEAATAKTSFTRDVKPFLTNYCVECHNTRTAKAGYNFENFETLMKGGRKGAALTAGEPDKSLILRCLAGQGKRMPPAQYAKKPQPAEIEKLKAWIAAGAKNDTIAGAKADHIEPLLELRQAVLATTQSFSAVRKRESSEAIQHE